MGLPHVLALPFPAQGHVIPLMELCYCLVDHGFKVTFTNPESIHNRIIAAHEVSLVSVPDGLGTEEIKINRNDLARLTEALQNTMPRCLEELIEKSNETGDPMTCMLVDANMGLKEVYDCLHWDFEKHPSLGALKSILNLSFNDLPDYLKNCFVYCSIFPEDYLIKRKKLIRLCVAEGFMKVKSSNRVMEEEAEYYLAQLVDRSMLQVVKRNELGRLKAFRMHDVVREVTLELSKNMRFCMILEGSHSVFDNQTCRLSIQTNVESHDLNTSLRLSRLRSLVVFCTSDFSSRSLRAVLLISLKMLRVLELEGSPISKLPNEVSALFNLRYLGLNSTEVEQLPNKIQKLQSLETLDIRDSNINKLPRGVTQLKQLCHLIMPPREVPTLEGASQWKNLQTLTFVRSNTKFVQRLGDMEELRSLGVSETSPLSSALHLIV